MSSFAVLFYIQNAIRTHYSYEIAFFSLGLFFQNEELRDRVHTNADIFRNR